MLATVQLRVIGLPEKSSAGACTLLTVKSGGGLRLMLKAALSASLSVRLNHGMANGWGKPERLPLGGCVMLVTTRSGRGTAKRLTETGATVVLLLPYCPSATVCVALVVTVNQRVPALWGRMTCCVRCTEAPTASVPVKV